MFCILAHPLEVVKVFGRYCLEYPPHARHGKRRQTIACAVGVELLHKVAHHLAALGDLLLFAGLLFDMCADVLHAV